jgi:ketosteroid isomerase-like protein
MIGAHQSSSSANQQLIERAYAAFAQGDIPTVLASIADDILWHVPGRGPISGDFRGHEQVLGFFSALHGIVQRHVPNRGG